MPNAPIDPTTPLAAFAVPLTSLEEAAGGQSVLSGCARVQGLGLRVQVWMPSFSAALLSAAMHLPEGISMWSSCFVRAGLHFFPAYLTESRRAALDTTAMSWQSLGRAQMQKGTPALRAELQSLLAADPSIGVCVLPFHEPWTLRMQFAWVHACHKHIGCDLVPGGMPRPCCFVRHCLLLALAPSAASDAFLGAFSLGHACFLDCPACCQDASGQSLTTFAL